jgi:class 3 adenylate cyclase
MLDGDGHSAFKPSDLIRVDHLVSLRSISAAYSSGVDANGSAPMVAKLRTPSVARAARNSLFRRSIIGRAARFYDAATILFADFEGFMKLAEEMEPRELIGQLDDYFSAFDEIAERHRLEMLID